MRFCLYFCALGMLLTSAVLAQTPQTPPEQAAALLLAQAQQRELAMATAAFQLKAKIDGLQKELDDLKAKESSPTPPAK